MKLDDLHFYAFNYRNAHSIDAHAAFLALESYVEKLITSQQTVQKTQETVHVIDGADWPAPDTGFSKLGDL